MYAVTGITGRVGGKGAIKPSIPLMLEDARAAPTGSIRTGRRSSIEVD